MDRQQFEQREIPVNARAVGSPMGINVLYLEDYVHTFIKKLMKKDEEEKGCEVFLYGYEFDEQGKHILVVSGACQHENRSDKAEKMGAQYFPMSSYLGEATIHSDGVSQMSMEILKEGTKGMVFKNFYIYYDQNEEMQNYLIEWNLEHRDYRSRAETEDSVRYGRMAQAYNKEEVRVNFLWNAMNVLSIGLVVCAMVYGIVSINNYHKMKNMEDKISYIVTTMTENRDYMKTLALLPETEEETEVFQTEIIEESKEEIIQETMKQVIEEETVTEEVIMPEDNIEEGQVSQEDPEDVIQDVQKITEIAANTDKIAVVPQYYVVQQGDTLRSICLMIYGNLDRMDEVCMQNGIVNPDSILCGQTLLLP